MQQTGLDNTVVSMIYYRAVLGFVFFFCDIRYRTGSGKVKSMLMVGTDEMLSCYIFRRREALQVFLSGMHSSLA